LKNKDKYRKANDYQRCLPQFGTTTIALATTTIWSYSGTHRS